MILSYLRRFLVKEAVRSIDISKALPIGKVPKGALSAGKGKPAVSTLKRTVITDVLEDPEKFIFEGWIEKDTINLRVRRRFEEVEKVGPEQDSILVDTVGEE